MLHKSNPIITAETFHLIKELQAFSEFENFYLVGGTALALQLGHRNSVDIDPPKHPLPLEKIKKRIREGVLHSNKLF